MDSRTIYFLSMVTVVIHVNDNNVVTFEMYPAIKGHMTELKGRKIVCNNLVQVLQGKTAGITIDVLKLKKDIGLYYGMACSAISSNGASIGDSKLQEMDKINFSYLYRSKTEDLKITLVTILKILNLTPLEYEKYRINTAFLLKLTELQTALNTSGVDTKVAINLHKDTKELLDEELKEMQILLAAKIDSAAEMMQIEHREVYKAYKSARKVAHHHMHDQTPPTPDPTSGTLALTLLKSDTAVPVQGATFAILSINFIAVSDINGEITNPSLLPGDYTGTITCDGLQPLEFSFTIKLGEITDLGFMLEDLPPTV